MALVEIDQVAIKKELWERVKAGHLDALAEVRNLVDGLAIYMHAMPVQEHEILVSLRDLEGACVAESVTISAEKERT